MNKETEWTLLSRITVLNLLNLVLQHASFQCRDSSFSRLMPLAHTSFLDSLRSFTPESYSYGTKSYNNLMYKAQQIKASKSPGKEIKRFQFKLAKNSERHVYSTTSSNYQVNVKLEKPRKCSDKIITERNKPQKPKKIKFITQEIEKSTQDLLSIGSKSHHKERSVKLSTHNVEEENVYEICKSSKRQKRGDKQEGKHQLGNIHHNNLNLGKVKSRREKTHSKDLNLKLGQMKVRYKSTKKTKRQTKSNKKSEKLLKPRQFLSPQIVKQQNSYYFQSCEHQQTHLNVLLIPKKETKYIFQSNQSIWKEQHKKMLNSTVDLLN